MSIRVLIADNHPVVRDGMRAVIGNEGEGIEIIGEASNGKDVLAMAKRNPVDVYVLEISMPELNGIDTTERLLRMDPKSKVIILSIHDSRSFVEKALKSGAKGYVVKEDATEEMIHAIREVYQGRFYLSPAISKYIVDGFLGRIHDKDECAMVNLTSREREILQLIAEGHTNKEIARGLGLSLFTVNVHRRNFMRKLDLHKLADLIRYAIKEGISEL